MDPYDFNTYHDTEKEVVYVVVFRNFMGLCLSASTAVGHLGSVSTTVPWTGEAKRGVMGWMEGLHAGTTPFRKNVCFGEHS